MVIDELPNAPFYRGLAPRLVRALDFLGQSNVAELALGRHSLDGDRLFALVQEYATKPSDQCRWEAHRRYCDVQFVAAGVERMGVALIGRMTEQTPYDADRDVAFFSGEGDFITFRTGMFAIFAPQDVHMPCLAAGMSSPVRKVVLKVEIE